MKSITLLKTQQNVQWIRDFRLFSLATDLASISFIYIRREKVSCELHGKHGWKQNLELYFYFGHLSETLINPLSDSAIKQLIDQLIDY